MCVCACACTQERVCTHVHACVRACASCAHVCAHVRVCAHMCMHVRDMRAHMGTCALRAQVRVCVHVCALMCTYEHMCIVCTCEGCARMCVGMRTHIHVCAGMCMCACMYVRVPDASHLVHLTTDEETRVESQDRGSRRWDPLNQMLPTPLCPAATCCHSCSVDFQRAITVGPAGMRRCPPPPLPLKDPQSSGRQPCRR